MEVAATGGGDHGIETRFVDWQFIGVPGIDASGVHVRHGDLDVWAFGGDHGHGWAADIAGAKAADGLNFHGKNSGKTACGGGGQW